MFDVAMGSFDGAEVCELIGLFALNTLAKKFGNENIGLYRDDCLALIQSTSVAQQTKQRKTFVPNFFNLV
jgi:hypothetical protein